MIRRKFIKGSAVLGMTFVGNTALIGESGMYSHRDERQIYRIITASGVNVGTLPVMRAFAGDHTDYVSPYLLFDEFGPVEIDAGTDGYKVDAHPHAGVTPTTYFVSGTGHHKDSLDYDFQIGKGDFMMFSSGKGAIHMEQAGKQMTEQGGVVHGFQIWLNTPKKYKWADPSTTVHRTKQMDKIKEEGYEIQVVLGELGDACSHVDLVSPAFYYHVKMDKDKRLDIPTDPTHNAFIYAIDASLELAGARQLRSNQLALYKRGQSVIRLYAKEASEFFVLGGQPLDEQVVSYGPFVMNSKEEINRCIRNYNSGAMGDPNLVN